jgi:Fe-S-cluster containining protein
MYGQVDCGGMLMSENGPKIRVKTFTFSLPTPYGNLPSLSIEVPDLPMSLAEVVPLLHAICNKCVEMACAHPGPDEKVRCSRGCGSCCRQVVPVSIPELLFLRTCLAELPPARRDRYQSRLESVVHAMQKDGVLSALQNAGSGQEALSAAQSYFNQGLDCPFLEDGACSIHPVRPFACREFNAISPPELCENPFLNRVRKVPVVPKMTSVAARFAAKATGEPPVLIPLVMAGNPETFQSTWDAAVPGVALFEMLFDSFGVPG